MGARAGEAALATKIEIIQRVKLGQKFNYIQTFSLSNMEQKLTKDLPSVRAKL